MKSFDARQLLEQLQADARQLIATTTLLKKEDNELLLTQPGEGRWSVIQVLAHLNSYAAYYIPALEKALQADKPAKLTFKPGWFGNYFTRIMQPQADGTIAKKMKSPKDHRPAERPDADKELENFLSWHQQLLDLLKLAERKDIGAIRVPISISKLIRLKAGDTFRFFLAHEERHFLQIARTLKSLGAAGKK